MRKNRSSSSNTDQYFLPVTICHSEISYIDWWVRGTGLVSRIGFPIIKNIMQGFIYNRSMDHHRRQHQSSVSHCVIPSGETPELPQPAQPCLSHDLSAWQSLLSTLLKDLQSQCQNGLPTPIGRQEPWRTWEDGLPSVLPWPLDNTASFPIRTNKNLWPLNLDHKICQRQHSVFFAKTQLKSLLVCLIKYMWFWRNLERIREIFSFY